MPSPRRVYLDYGAASPVAPEVFQAMEPYLRELYASPAGLSREGKLAQEAVEQARKQVKRLVNAPPGSKVIFTASACEANNLALRGFCRRNRRKGDHLIVSRAAHKSILKSADRFEGPGFTVTRLSVDSQGQIDPGELVAELRPTTLMVSLMAANNEVGALQPLPEVGAALRERATALHLDARAIAGKASLDMQALGAGLVSLSSNNLYGPKGVGALVVAPRLRLEPLIVGGDQEYGLRAGSANVPGIVGLGAAAELAGARLEADAARLTRLRDRLIAHTLRTVEGSQLVGHPSERLPTSASFAFPGAEALTLVAELERHGILAAANNPCAAKSLEPSHVLAAMNLPEELARCTLHFNLGRDTGDKDIDYLLEVLPVAVERVRGMAGHRLV